MFSKKLRNYSFSKKQLDLTFQYSIKLQILAGIISLFGLFIKLKKEDSILYTILLMETIVQFIEGFWYLNFYYFTFNRNQLNDIATKRYDDWYLYTPIMLLSTAIFMQYTYEKENKLPVSTLHEILSEKFYPLLSIAFFNYTMLVFGKKYEKKEKGFMNYLYYGFISFFLSFYILYQSFASKSKKGKQLFAFVFVIWFFYGIAALQPTIPKNIYYNILDIISKNFYGIYILYEIYQNRIIE